MIGGGGMAELFQFDYLFLKNKTRLLNYTTSILRLDADFVDLIRFWPKLGLIINKLINVSVTPPPLLSSQILVI